mgnify:CR=1 FL=1
MPDERLTRVSLVPFTSTIRSKREVSISPVIRISAVVRLLLCWHQAESVVRISAKGGSCPYPDTEIIRAHKMKSNFARPFMQEIYNIIS